MKRYSSTFVFLYLLLTLSFANSPFSFRHYQVENGLSENTVLCILQDSRGFMWFGTKDGLNRFDGKHFVVYQNEANNDKSIGNNYILSLYEDTDKILWVGTENGVYLFNQETREFKRFVKTAGNDEKIKGSVTSIIADKTGNIWISTLWFGVYKYNIATGKLINFRNIKNNNSSISSDFIWNLYCDYQGTIWLGTISNGLCRYNSKTNNFTTFNLSDKRGLSDNSILRIFEDSQGNFLIGTINEGLVVFDRTTGNFKSYLKEISNKKIFYFRDISEYSPGILLLGTENGLIYYEVSTGKTEQFVYSYLAKNTISDNAIYCFCKDREGSLWIGTYFGGINYLSVFANPFELYSPNATNNSIKGKAISQFCEDQHGNLWIGSEDGGLSYYDTKTNSFKNYSPQSGKNSISYHNIHSLLLHNNKLWIGTFAGGLNILDLYSGIFKNYISTSDINSISDNNVISIYKDLTGTIWLGTVNGLNKYNPKNDNFIRIPQVSENTHVYDIIQDHLGLLWFGTYGNGIFCLDPKRNTWKHYLNNPEDKSTVSSNKITSLFIDSKKRLWFCTEGGGICQFSYKSNTFSSINKSHGLPNNVIYKIVEDRDFLWLSTNKGLVQFHPEKLSVKVFTKEDGLQSDQFNFRSGLKTKSGKIYFGGINGFNAFYPEEIIENKTIPDIYFTNMRLFNKEVGIGKEKSLLKKDISFLNEITLTHNQSFVSFEFAALSFVNPNKNKYAYKLEGFDKEWNEIKNDNYISFMNLPAGNYVLRLKGSNNNNVWNNNGVSLKINVLPPWWKSNLALFIYLIGIILTIYYFGNRIKKKHLAENKLHAERLNTEKEIEIYNAKIDFFTNIAHEIRTPLSLIKAPLEYIIKISTENTMTEYLSLIQRNTDRLLALVNQLLDFRKAEKNNFKTNFKQVNLTKLIQSVFEDFKISNKNSTVKFEIELPEKEIYATVDSECINKIISNLLSNALKHTKSEIKLTIIQEENNDESIEIQIFDNGEGINICEQINIFEPFYQIKKHNSINQGTGLGLSLVKLLVDMHKGTIKVDSDEGKYCKFIIYLPFKQLNISNTEYDSITDTFDEKLLANDSGSDIQITIDKKELPTIFIVEDNKELNWYITSYFNKKYNTYSAFNGLEAKKLLENVSPNIIVTDIIMPEIDGLELCKFLKSNTLYCHIPVIMLTAKTDLQSKIEGLEYGADAYIEKPFSSELLEAQIKNLLESRDLLKHNFINSPLTAIRTIGHNKADELFLNRITETIELNITNLDFTVEDLAFQLSMSRSNLLKKLKGISGLSPTDFIRIVKLKKAVKLMEEGETRINEIAFMVGFNSPSYFTKCFEKQFGILPKEFVRNL